MPRPARSSPSRWASARAARNKLSHRSGCCFTLDCCRRLNAWHRARHIVLGRPADRGQLLPVDPQQLDVPRKVVGPMTCQAAPTLGPQRLPELGENPHAAPTGFRPRISCGHSASTLAIASCGDRARAARARIALMRAPGGRGLPDEPSALRSGLWCTRLSVIHRALPRTWGRSMTRPGGRGDWRRVQRRANAASRESLTKIATYPRRSPIQYNASGERRSVI